MALSLTPAERRLRARAAAYALHAQGGTNTKPAYQARIAKLEAQVDPDGSLTPEERARRVHFALRSQMAALALRRSRTRSQQPDAAA